MHRGVATFQQQWSELNSSHSVVIRRILATIETSDFIMQNILVMGYPQLDDAQLAVTRSVTVRRNEPAYQHNPCPTKAQYASLKSATSSYRGLETIWKNHG